MHSGPYGGAEGSPEQRPASTSERLQLEIDLLTDEHLAVADGASGSAEGASTVLLALSDADIRDYVRQCLHGRADLRIIEIPSADSPFDVAHRVRAQLVITDMPMVNVDPTHVRRVPVLLTGDELPERLPVGEGIRMAFLLQPFNARRLVEAVDNLL